MYVKKLFESGLLFVGQGIFTENLRFTAVVTTGGSLELSNWPLPCHSLKQATRRAQEFILYGAHVGASNFKTPSMLHFWKYQDDITCREEKLGRLWNIANSSWEQSDSGCELCRESRCNGFETPREDIFCQDEFDPDKKRIVPRWHFTDLQRIPKRDKSALERFVGKVVKDYVTHGMDVTIKTESNGHGHSYLVIEPVGIRPRETT